MRWGTTWKVGLPSHTLFSLKLQHRLKRLGNVKHKQQRFMSRKTVNSSVSGTS